jgi:phosphatidylserine/phosphatidylglycerophosphate/cardiolipin synthase-like enzyme
VTDPLDLESILRAILAEQSGDARGGPSRSYGLARLTAALESRTRDPQGLSADIEAGLAAAARRLDRVDLAVTGLAWLGAGAPSVDQELRNLVRSARREISACAYSITTNALSLLAEIDEVVAQGVTATLVVNALTEQHADVQSFLRGAARARDRWRIYDFVASGPAAELHAKVVVVDRSAALLGSANLSYRGLVANHEIAVVVRGPTAESIASRIDMLTNGPSARRL